MSGEGSLGGCSVFKRKILLRLGHYISAVKLDISGLPISILPSRCLFNSVNIHQVYCEGRSVLDVEDSMTKKTKLFSWSFWPNRETVNEQLKE